MKKILAILLTVLMAFTVVVPVSAADTDVAAIGETTYATLQAAIDAAAADDTVKLIKDVTENVTITKKLTLDGDGKQFTGKITLKKVNATIQNVNFVDGQIYKSKSTGTAGTVTVKNCNFEGAIADNQYAINLGAVNNIIIEDCNAKDVGFGFFYAPSTTDTITVKNVSIDGASYGIHIVYNNTSTIENVTMKNVAYGVMIQTYGAKTVTFKNCTVDAETPVFIWERKATTQNFIFKGENDFGTDDLTFGSTLVNAKVDVAKVGTETYETLGDAVAAAADGDTVTVIADHEIASSDVCEKVSGMYPFIAVTDKKIIIDLNGKNVAVNPDLDAKMLAVFYAGGSGELTLKDSSEAQTGSVTVTMAEGTQAYSMFTTLGTDGAKMYIESGSYTIDKVDYGQSMIYSGQDKQIAVSGGNFVLGNAKTRDPGNGEMQPWIFNAHGDGVKVITVTGGTYNVDPTHYHGEANFPDCYTPVDEGEKWVVKIVHTPGDAATCQAAQTCTVCGEELDAIKDHTYGEYVSDGNATCEADGTKTAECIYGCGKTDTVVDAGSKGDHADVDGDGNCDGCNGEFCDTCGRVHEDWISKLICLIVDFVNLVISFIKSVK